MKKIGVLIFWSFAHSIFAQVVNTGLMDTTSGLKIGPVGLTAYVDTYYGYNFNQPKSKVNDYFFAANQHNTFSINLAYLDMQYNGNRVRGRFVPGFGSYMNANYAHEKGGFQYIVDASIGVKPLKKKNIWIDAGILGSPYTNESAISKDHLMYARSLSSENTPYYLCGVKLSVPINEKWNFYTYLINGWQQITDQNNGKSIGTQVEFRPNKKNLLNWNTYLGDERNSIDTNNRMRYFTDIYWIYKGLKGWDFTSCAYVGFQERFEGLNSIRKYRSWWQANFIARYTWLKTYSVSARMEYFNDPYEAIIRSVTAQNTFNCMGAGLSFAYRFEDFAMFRIEGRYLQSADRIFMGTQQNALANEFQCFANLTVWF